MPIIRLPAAADLPFPELAEALRLHGFTVLSVSTDRMEVRAPGWENASPLEFRWWLPFGTMTYVRSATGYVISHRLSKARIAASSLLAGVVTSTSLHGALSVRLAIGCGVALAVALWQTFTMRQEPRVMEFTLEPLADRIANEDDLHR